MLMREIKDDTNRWKNIPHSWIRKINIVKMTILPKAIYRFNAVSIKSPMAFFTVLEQKILKFIWKHKTPKQPKQRRERKKELEESVLNSDYTTKQYDSSTKIDIQINRVWNRIESPEITPCTFVYLIHNKGGNNTQWKKDNLFNKRCWEKWKASGKRMKSEHSPTPYTKINSKGIKDLNLRPDTMKPLEKHKSQ